MCFAFNQWKNLDDMANRNQPLRELLEQRRLRRDTMDRDEIRDQRRERRRRIVNRLAELVGILGGQFTGANWIGKAVALFVLSLAAAVAKWIFLG
jgi:hypothetical protein